MKRLRWSKLLSLAAMGLAVGIASAQVPARIPATYPNGSNPLAAAGTLAVFEGPNATDYFNFQQNFNLLANPQIASGPEDILMIVNSQIFRVPNGNAPGVTPTNLYPNYTAIGGQPTSYQRAFLDNWLGEAAVNQLCPTGATTIAGGVTPDSANSRTSTTCRFENAEVKYDQMHGRFLVLFTVVDTGLTFDPFAQSYRTTRPRKASWVLLVSRFAVLADQACLQGTTACTVPGPTPGGPNPAGTFVFLTPTPGVAANTGGINTGLWASYFGDSVSGIGSSDGFGSNKAHAGAWVGTVGVGNINSLPGIAGSSASFDCSPGAIYAPETVGNTVCYFPTAARLGIDNDTVTIVSPVVNVNINSLDVSPTFNPTGALGTFKLPAYAGSRVRVIKKTGLYTFATLAAGNQFAGSEATKATGTYYDLYTNDGTGVPFLDTAGGSPKVYTALASTTQCASGTDYSLMPQNGPPTPISACSPLFYEPAHLRGRSQATFSNDTAILGNGKSQTYLVGNIAQVGFHTEYAIQGIREIQVSVPVLGALGSFYPVLQNNLGNGQQGLPTFNFTSTGFTNPGTVPQQNFRNSVPGTTAPNLFVGDSRPHSVIFREGHLYEAQVSAVYNPQTIFPGNPNYPGAYGTNAVSSTVVYNVFQKLNAGYFPNTILTTQWQNSQVYAPMFDVPSNVKLIGQVTPSGILPYLEKVFAATTFPPLAGLPVASTSAPWDQYAALNAGDPRSRETFGATGLAPTQLPATANCFNYQYNPGVPLNGSTTGNPSAGLNIPLSWGSLFDVRCGQDATDSNPSLQDPYSGVVTSRYAYTVRGGASIDPNDGSIWLLGAYAQKRNTGINSTAHWGTMGANYKLSAPPTVDEYGNATNLYTDVVGIPEALTIQIAVNVGLTPNIGSAGYPLAAPNVTPLPITRDGNSTTLYPAGSNPAGTTLPGVVPTGTSFGPNDFVTRREMAAWIVKSQMDEQAISDYITATGGNLVTFADVPTTDPGYRYVEVMARKGYTSGCSAGVARRYCPDYISTRKDLAVFMIRAKFSNVFPTVLSGCAFTFVSGTTTPAPSTLYPPATTTNCSGGDNFGYFTTGLAYFDDNKSVTGNDEWVFIQKMRELRITNGTYLGPANDGRNGHYARGPVGFTALPSTDAVDGLNGYLLRKQVATFMVRGFFH